MSRFGPYRVASAKRNGLLPESQPAELDLWRAAQQLIRSHGAKAEAKATEMAMRANDDQAKDVWLSILGKVRALQAGHTPDLGPLN